MARCSCSVGSAVNGLLFVVMAGIAGSAFLFTDEAKTDFPPFSLAGLRLTIGAASLAVLLALWSIVTRCAACRSDGGKVWDGDEAPGLVAVSLALIGLAIFNSAVPYTIYPVRTKRVCVCGWGCGMRDEKKDGRPTTIQE